MRQGETIRAVSTVAAAVAALTLIPSAGGYPKRWHAPRWWLPQAVCIHRHEGAWNANTGNGYYGGMQFLLSTWRSVGGRGYPHQWSPKEQLYRAWLVWDRDAGKPHDGIGSWVEWGTARMCGLR